MVRYRWEIQTADSPYSGTDGEVTLSLHGTRGVTEDFPLQSDKYSRGELASGLFEADEDLGEITSGSLYTKLDPGRPWDIAFVRITNLVTGKAWSAEGVGACTQEGCPLLRFEVDRDASAEALDNKPAEQQNKEAVQELNGDRETSPARREDPPRERIRRSARCEDRPRALVRRFKESLELLQQLQDPEQQTIVRELGASAMPLVRKLLGKPQPSDTALSEGRALVPVGDAPPPAPQFVTIELFAMRNGQKVPLPSVLAETSSGALALAPGARVLMTDQPHEGFGLGGRPGAWSFGPPSAFGIDGGDVGFVALDGFTVKPLGAWLLGRLFGDWRSVLLGTSAPLGARGDGT